MISCWTSTGKAEDKPFGYTRFVLPGRPSGSSHTMWELRSKRSTCRTLSPLSAERARTSKTENRSDDQDSRNRCQTFKLFQYAEFSQTNFYSDKRISRCKFRTSAPAIVILLWASPPHVTSPCVKYRHLTYTCVLQEPSFSHLSESDISTLTALTTHIMTSKNSTFINKRNL